MEILIVVVVIVILFTLFFLPLLIRAYARRSADQILNTHRPSTEKRIKRYIAILTQTNKWITNLEDPDQLRINRLRDMLKEMQKPHG